MNEIICLSYEHWGSEDYREEQYFGWSEEVVRMKTATAIGDSAIIQGETDVIIKLERRL